MVNPPPPTVFGRSVHHPVLALAVRLAPFLFGVGKLAIIAPAHCVLYWSGRRGLMRDGETAIDCRSLERRKRFDE